MKRADWKRVSERRRCPVCDRPDWCLYAGPDDAPTAAICARVESDRSAGEGGRLHRLRDDDRRPVRSVVVRCRPQPQAAPVVDFGLFARECTQRLQPQDPQRLAGGAAGDETTFQDTGTTARHAGTEPLTAEDHGGGPGTYDVFLCYNSNDSQIVRQLYDKLKKDGLSVWFDQQNVGVGALVVGGIEGGLRGASSVAVCVGATGIGRWQRVEYTAALRLAVTKGRLVIPVLLPGAGDKPGLPLFLETLRQVDFRSGFTEEGTRKLIRDIKAARRQTSGPGPDRLVS